MSHQTTTIVSIKDIGIQDVYDVQVEHDHSYVSEGGFINHNTSSNPNLQQLPRNGKIRKCFIPEKGHKIIVSDYSQVELRLTAFYSKDPEMLKCYSEDLDIHSRTAIASFGLKCPIDKVKELFPDERYKAKTINFGLIYGMSPRTLAENLKVSLEEAQQAYNGYFRTYKKVRPFMESVKGLGRQQGFVRSYSGRKRRCTEMRDVALYPQIATPEMYKTVSFQEREVANFVIQGTGADMMKLSMVRMYPLLKQIGARMLMTVHDEIVVSCPEDKCDEGVRIIKDCMEKVFPKICEVVPIISDPGVADNWGDAK